MSTYPMTKQGEAALQKELDHLKSVERPAVIEAISEARAHGDLKENAEYHAAREKQGFIEGRIQDVEAKLGNAQVIDVTQIPNEGKVIFGATVKLVNLEDDSEVTYRIVGDDEADIEQGLISFSAPVARAVIGKFINDEVTVITPKGETDYEIIAVDYL